MIGHVYILTNPSMPGLVKIGRTSRDVDQRSRELFQSGVPSPFSVHYSVFTPDCEALEASAHALLYITRLATNREFFRVSPEKAEVSLRTAFADQMSGWLSPFLSDELMDRVFTSIEEGK